MTKNPCSEFFKDCHHPQEGAQPPHYGSNAFCGLLPLYFEGFILSSLSLLISDHNELLEVPRHAIFSLNAPRTLQRLLLCLYHISCTWPWLSLSLILTYFWGAQLRLLLPGVVFPAPHSQLWLGATFLQVVNTLPLFLFWHDSDSLLFRLNPVYSWQSSGSPLKSSWRQDMICSQWNPQCPELRWPIW